MKTKRDIGTEDLDRLSRICNAEALIKFATALRRRMKNYPAPIGCCCMETRKNLAEVMGVTETTLGRWLNRLMELEAITVEPAPSPYNDLGLTKICVLVTHEQLKSGLFYSLPQGYGESRS